MHFLDKSYFSPVEDEAQARRMFKSAVEIVAIETSSFCNRRCSYCPNATNDRIGNKKYLDEGLFNRIIQDLAEIEYDRDIVLTRFNEPMADPSLIDRLKYARARLPKATLAIFSNGDYLDRPLLDALYDAGLRRLTMSTHLGNDGVYDHDEVIRRIFRKVADLGLVTGEGRHTRGYGIWIPVIYKPDMEFSIQQFDHARVGNSRGGLVAIEGLDEKLKDFTRTDPCSQPLRTFNVDYLGNITPCCLIIPDAPPHGSYAAGTLRDFRSIFEAYAKGPLAGWRRHLLTTAPKSAPCASCDVVWRVEEADRQRIAELEA